MAAAFGLGLFWQQSGWLAHDFLHHQVFDTREWNNWVGLMVGSLWQVRIYMAMNLISINRVLLSHHSSPSPACH
jgi:hypothetical protein